MYEDISDVQKVLWEPSLDAFLAPFSTNVAGVYFTSIAFLHLLHAGNKKCLRSLLAVLKFVVMSSIAGYSKHIQSSIAYSASKAAATHLAKNLATYFTNLHIRVNVLGPGLYPSEMTGASESDETGYISMAGKQILWGDVPAQRPGMERETGGLGMFMAR